MPDTTAPYTHPLVEVNDLHVRFVSREATVHAVNRLTHEGHAETQNRHTENHPSSTRSPKIRGKGAAQHTFSSRWGLAHRFAQVAQTLDGIIDLSGPTVDQVVLPR